MKTLLTEESPFVLALLNRNLLFSWRTSHMHEAVHTYSANTHDIQASED